MPVSPWIFHTDYWIQLPASREMTEFLSLLYAASGTHTVLAASYCPSILSRLAPVCLARRSVESTKAELVTTRCRDFFSLHCCLLPFHQKTLLHTVICINDGFSSCMRKIQEALAVCERLMLETFSWKESACVSVLPLSAAAAGQSQVNAKPTHYHFRFNLRAVTPPSLSGTRSCESTISSTTT